jgi:hypothetical protein
MRKFAVIMCVMALAAAAHAQGASKEKIKTLRNVPANSINHQGASAPTVGLLGQTFG